MDVIRHIELRHKIKRNYHRFSMIEAIIVTDESIGRSAGLSIGATERREYRCNLRSYFSIGRPAGNRHRRIRNSVRSVGLKRVGTQLKR